MENKFKGVYLFISSIVISIIHLSFGFAKNTGHLARQLFNSGDSVIHTTADSLFFSPEIKSVYDSLQLNLRGLSRDAYDYAKKGLEQLAAQGRIMNQSIISIVDFSLPSTEKRLFVIDLNHYKILFNTLVAHGRNSGKEMAFAFSNQHSSYKSSPGFYTTTETYMGKNGYSLRLAGLENGINDNALERGIVIHGADYVNEHLANVQGYIGRSQGCPAVPAQQAIPLINQIKNGTLLFIYHPAYIKRSALLN
jgi:hypothetical protein